MPLIALTTAAAHAAMAAAIAAPAHTGHVPAAAPAHRAVGAPCAPSATTATTGWREYRVRQGETLGRIARRSGTTVNVLAQTNHLTRPGFLLVGQRLAVPTQPGATHQKPCSATPAPTTRAAAAPTTSRRATKAKTTNAVKVRAASANRPTAAPVSADPSKAEVGALLTSTAQRHGVDAHLVRAIAMQESAWTQSVRSPVGAVGIMQVMPANQGWLSSLAGRPLDLTKADDNVTAGVVMLKYLGEHASSPDNVIGAYYQGLPSIERRGPYAETVRYIAGVKRLRAGL